MGTSILKDFLIMAWPMNAGHIQIEVLVERLANVFMDMGYSDEDFGGSRVCRVAFAVRRGGQAESCRATDVRARSVNCRSTGLPARIDSDRPEGESVLTATARPIPDWDLEQLEVILDDPESWQLVVAGPGAGKSAVACQRVASLVDDGVQPSRILLISFTRTAAAELRERIVSYAMARESARAVRISTIDSHAWSLRAGFDDKPFETSLADNSYELSIAQAVDLFRNDNPDLLDFMDRVEHLIIDEAQDVVGIRADLVIEILRSLSEECGVTILADPAQAIYGFTSDNRENTEHEASLLDQLERNSPRKLVPRQLTHVYRIQNHDLLKVFYQTRDEVERVAGDTGDVDRIVSTIHDTALHNLGSTSHKEVAKYLADHGSDSFLVLFRRRVDVLLASSYCTSYGVQHRLRMAGVPTMVHPWIGWMFAEFGKPLVTRREFDVLWDQRAAVSPTPFEGEDKDKAWTVLRQLAAGGRNNVVDLTYLRKLVSRTHPPIELSLPNLGMTGPILGTIHASKGREADSVALVCPAVRRRSESDSRAEEREEGRVYYVGATRARETLITASNGGSGARYMESGRIYRRLRSNGKQPPRIHFEVGRDGDIDRLAHLGWTTTGEIQRVLAESVHLTLPLRAICRPTHDFKFRLVLEPETARITTKAIEIAQLGQAFHYDLHELWSKVDTADQFRPGDYMEHIHLVGVTTVALSDSEKESIGPPHSNSGFALAPVIKGLTVVQFLYRKKRYVRW
ncbi:MAG: AAA family ATPase [Acidimicrobiia bacterium]|nr:AAA family ATPase [Acidimicrobiia bacterium]